MPSIGEVALVLEAWCPTAWAESWDNVGLLLGDPSASVRRCMCALDADRPTIEAAAAAGAELLVTHHPLPFRPLRRIVGGDVAGSAVMTALRLGVAVYAAHTNFDVHPEGTNVVLSRRLDLRGARWLRRADAEDCVRLTVFVPAADAVRVRDALFAAGAGEVPAQARGGQTGTRSGDLEPVARYRDCSFASVGTGTFTPLPGARPALGRVGALASIDEVRLEVAVLRARLDAVLAALFAAHPYEEPAFDVVRLDRPRVQRGLGVVGDLQRSEPLGDWASWVAQALGAPTCRLVGNPKAQVRRVAVCGGAGAELAQEARQAGADVLVTADVRYHEAREAEAMGLHLVDPGHQATEAPAVAALAGGLRAAWASRTAEPLEVVVGPERTDVWRPVGAGSA